jgi:hypothetical protein
LFGTNVAKKRGEYFFNYGKHEKHGKVAALRLQKKRPIYFCLIGRLSEHYKSLFYVFFNCAIFPSYSKCFLINSSSSFEQLVKVNVAKTTVTIPNLSIFSFFYDFICFY